MGQFKFSTISRAEIEGSLGGSQMILAIDYDGPDHLLITGCPGSGKTTINIMRAERLVLLKKKIFLMTYQDLLKNSLINISSDALKPNIYKFFKWFSSTFRFLHEHEDENIIIPLMTNWNGVDEIIIDEGQDFEARIFRSLLPKTIKLTVGADNAQRVHSKGLSTSEIYKELGNANANVFQINLQYNYRNTFEIYNFGRYFLPHNERANNLLAIDRIPKGKGESPTVFLVPDYDSHIAQLKILLENAGDRNVAVLVYFQNEVDLYHKIISEMGIECSKHSNNSHVGDYIENVIVTTYKSAKGLEFQVVIMPNMRNIMYKHYMTGEHYYISCTRAKENLFLIIEGSDIPQYLTTFEDGCFSLNKTTTMPRPAKKPENVIDIDVPF